MSEWRIDVDGQGTLAILEPADDGSTETLFVCAHGAGGSRNDRGTLAAARTLRSQGMAVVRFDFPYRARGSGRPDPMPVLMRTVTAVIDRARAEVAPARLIIGGRSMGGRAASMLAAESSCADGLLLLAYPLHPAGQPEKLRDAHLPRITMPVLCINGTRDTLCTPALMTAALESVIAPWHMHWIDGADHSFHVLKSSGRTDAEVLAEIGSVSRAWLDRLPG